MLIFYRYLTLGLLVILPLFPLQLDTRINHLIYATALIFLPIFLAESIKRLKKGERVTICWLIFLLIGLVSTYYSIDQIRSLYNLGVFVGVFIFSSSIGRIFLKIEDKEKIALAILGTSLILSLISFWNTVIRQYVNKQQEGVSFMWTYFSHNHISALLLFTIPISLYFTYRNWTNPFRRLGMITISAFFVCSLFLTLSKGGTISLILALILGLLGSKFLDIKRTLTISVILTLMAAMIIINFKQTGTYLGIRREVNLSDRDIYWQTAVIKSLEKPLLGYGLDTFRHVKAFEFSKKITKPFYVHNFLLEMLYSTGLLGLLSIIILLGSVFYEKIVIIKEEINLNKYTLNLALLIGLLGSLLNSLVDFDWQLPTIFLIFWILTGLIAPKKPHLL